MFFCKKCQLRMTTVRMRRVLNGFNVSHVEGVQLEEVHTFLLSYHLFRRPVPGCPYLNYHRTLTRFFASGFFHESGSPQPQSILVRTFQIFRKFKEIFASQGAPAVSTTPVANFSTIFASVVDTGGKFATGVNDTCGKQWEQLSNW
jgi:hypothetical protein